MPPPPPPSLSATLLVYCSLFSAAFFSLLFWEERGALRGRRCWGLLYSEWWPKTESLHALSFAETTSENVQEETEVNSKLVSRLHFEIQCFHNYLSLQQLRRYAILSEELCETDDKLVMKCCCLRRSHYISSAPCFLLLCRFENQITMVVL